MGMERKILKIQPKMKMETKILKIQPKMEMEIKILKIQASSIGEILEKTFLDKTLWDLTENLPGFTARMNNLGSNWRRHFLG